MQASTRALHIVSVALLLIATGPTSAGDTQAISVATIAGTWSIENPADRHDLSGTKTLQLNADGTALLNHDRMAFNRRWKLSGGQLVITDPPGQVPGPPKHFEVVEVSAKMDRLRLKSDFPRSARDVVLVRAR